MKQGDIFTCAAPVASTIFSNFHRARLPQLFEDVLVGGGTDVQDVAPPYQARQSVASSHIHRQPCVLVCSLLQMETL